MPRFYMLKFHAYSTVTLLLFSSIFGFTVKAQNTTLHNECSNSAAECIQCPSMCPEGYYNTTETECPKSSTSAPSTTVATFTTGNVTNTTTIANTGASGKLPTAGTNLSTSTQPTTVTNLITCWKCSIENCIACSSNIKCTQCANDFTLTDDVTCQHNRVKDEETDHSALIGGVVGGVVGGLVVIGIIVLVIVWWRRRHQRQPMNSSTVEQQELEHQEPEPRQKEPKQDPKLADDVVNMHDKILRYTTDPTIKRLPAASSPEDEELDELPAAPPPPNKTYDHVGSGENYSDSYTEFKGQPTQDYHHRRHTPPPPPSEEENVYGNQQSIAQAQDEADGMYANTLVLKSELQQLKAQGHSGNLSRSGSSAQKNNVDIQARQTAGNEDDDACAEPEDIYTNDNAELIAARVEEDKETEEIYLNENFEEEDIYLNVSK